MLVISLERTGTTKQLWMEAHQLWSAKLSKPSSNTHPVSCMWHNSNRLNGTSECSEHTYICMYILYVQCHRNGVLHAHSGHAMKAERNSDHIAVSPATKGVRVMVGRLNAVQQGTMYTKTKSTSSDICLTNRLTMLTKQQEEAFCKCTPHQYTLGGWFHTHTHTHTHIYTNVLGWVRVVLFGLFPQWLGKSFWWVGKVVLERGGVHAQFGIHGLDR